VKTLIKQRSTCCTQTFRYWVQLFE